MRILVTHPVILRLPKERIVPVGETVDVPEGTDYSQWGRPAPAAPVAPPMPKPPDTLSALARAEAEIERLRLLMKGLPVTTELVPGAAPPPAEIAGTAAAPPAPPRRPPVLPPAAPPASAEDLLS